MGEWKSCSKKMTKWVHLQKGFLSLMTLPIPNKGMARMILIGIVSATPFVNSHDLLLLFNCIAAPMIIVTIKNIDFFILFMFTSLTIICIKFSVFLQVLFDRSSYPIFKSFAKKLKIPYQVNERLSTYDISPQKIVNTGVLFS